jgi:hypothetical protein
VGYNSFALVAPDMSNAWNFSYLLFKAFLLQVRFDVCPGNWPPQSIELDCPPLYGLVDTAFNLFSYSKTLYLITTNFVDVAWSVLGGVVCSSAGIPANQCTFSPFALFGYVLDMVTWVLSDFLSPIMQLIMWFWNELRATDPNLPAMTGNLSDVRVIWAFLVTDINEVYIALLRFLFNSIMSLPDRLLCSIFKDPLNCIMFDICLSFVRNVCIGDICLPDTACDPFKAGTCACYYTASPLGVMVPC